MKKIIIVSILFLLAIPVANARIKIPIGNQSKQEVVYNFPDTEDYLLDSGNYANLGRYYEVFTIVGIPIWVTQEPQLTIVDKDKHYELKPEYEENILKENNLDKDKLLSLGFFTRFGGKLILLVIAIIIIFGIVSRK